ncbi:MAG: hypothetical protein AAGJ38_02345 [Planctomycetota bacterium]
MRTFLEAEGFELPVADTGCIAGASLVVLLFVSAVPLLITHWRSPRITVAGWAFGPLLVLEGSKTCKGKCPLVRDLCTNRATYSNFTSTDVNTDG